MKTIKEGAITVAIVNNQKIKVVSENGNDFVPIRPICDALGIDPKSQRDRIKRDQILSSVGGYYNLDWK